MSDALVGLAAGLAAGVVMTRGGLCFNRAVRQAALEHKPRLLRAFGLAVAVQLLLLPVLVAGGVDPLERNAQTGGLPLLPVAQVAGGLTFGIGMALAGGCVTGMLWKAGAGAMALAIAIAGFAAGELLIRGPGESLIADLDAASRPDERALTGLLGLDYEPLAVAIGVAALVLLLRRRRDGLVPGVALGVVAAAAWVAADAAGYGYGLGFVGAAEGTRRAVDAGGQLPFQLWLALGVVAGGAIAGRPRLRTPGAGRAARAAVGGVLMGAGGSVAHGCNIGHGLTGVPLLSFGSLLAVTCMALGAIAVGLAYRPRRGPARLLRR